MVSQIQQLKNNFFKVYSDWANGQYELSKYGDDKFKLLLSFDQLALQPTNSAMIIGRQIVHRLYIPTTEMVLSYDVVISDNRDANIIYFGDFDLYVTVIEGEIEESITNTHLKHNIVYIIPAGQYYFFKTDNRSRYHMALKKKPDFKENEHPTELGTYTD